MKLVALDIPGCARIENTHVVDARGSFTKCYGEGLGPRFTLAECFVTVSCKGTLRGMHLHQPPFHQWKLVSCVQGAAFDVLVDLRRDSPTFRRTYACQLGPEPTSSLLVAPGVAHGFLALTDGTILMYCTSSLHSVDHDRGVRWDSIDVDWPAAPSVISARDAAMPPLADYEARSMADYEIG